MTTYINPRPQPVRLTLADGTEQTVAAWGLVVLEQVVSRAEVLEPKQVQPADRTMGAM